MKSSDEKDHLLGGSKKTAADTSGEKVVAYKGARPKVRSLKEPHRHRILVKKARSLSQGVLLESVTEMDKNEEEDRGKSETRRLVLPSDESEKKQSSGIKSGGSDDGDTDRSCKELFGVRSYLHNFYEAFAVLGSEEFEESDYFYLIAPQKRRRSALCWKALLLLGAILLLFGLIVLLVGYLAARRPVVIGYEQDMEIIDRTALTFDRNLDLCKIVGVVLFCIGGIIMATVLLVPTLLNRYCDDDSAAATVAETFKVADPDLVTPPRSPTEKKVPATEELKTVQPKRGEDDEVVMTHAGLCKVP